VVLACGSFESNPEMRARYLGPGWELARVAWHTLQHGRGSHHGEGIGAKPYGHWSGCHSVAWDIQTRRPYGDLTVGDSSRSTIIRSASWSTPRANATSTKAPISTATRYAKYGGEIVKLPGMFAWQVFDA